MTSFVLRSLDLFQNLFRWLGADYEQLREIVAIKFLMQNRRPSVSLGQQQYASDDGSHNNAFWRMCLIMLVLGGIMSAFLWFTSTPYYGFVLPFSYALMMSILILVTDFSTLLLDTTDNAVLLPRPVNARTILLARLVYIGAYLFFVSYSIMLVGLIVIGIKYGIVALLVAMVLVFWQAMIALFLTTLLYMLLMRFTSEERLKDVISYFQIVFTFVVTVGYQLIGRLLDFFEISTVHLYPSWWHYLWPSFWTSGTLQWVISRGEQWFPMVVLSIVVPLLLMWILNQYLAPFFNQYMAQLGSGDGGGIESIHVQKRRNWVSQLAQLFTSNAAEKSAFELSWKITARDRRFKMRTYPTLGSILPIIFLVGRDIFTKGFDATSKIYLMMLYATIIIVQAFYQQTSYSEDFKAAWIYFAVPSQRPRDFLMGNLKVVILKFFTPFYGLVAFFIFYLWGYNVLDDILLCYLIALMMPMFEVLMDGRLKLPFAKSPKALKEVSQTSQFVLYMFLLPCCGLLHWGLTFVPYGILIACVVVGYLTYDLYRRYEHIPWDKIDF